MLILSKPWKILNTSIRFPRSLRLNKLNKFSSLRGEEKKEEEKEEKVKIGEEEEVEINLTLLHLHLYPITSKHQLTFHVNLKRKKRSV